MSETWEKVNREEAGRLAAAGHSVQMRGTGYFVLREQDEAPLEDEVFGPGPNIEEDGQ